VKLQGHVAEKNEMLLTKCYNATVSSAGKHHDFITLYRNDLQKYQLAIAGRSLMGMHVPACDDATTGNSTFRTEAWSCVEFTVSSFRKKYRECVPVWKN